MHSLTYPAYLNGHKSDASSAEWKGICPEILAKKTEPEKSMQTYQDLTQTNNNRCTIFSPEL